jgi:phage-related protein
MNVEFLTLPNGKCPVEDFLDDLDEKTAAKVQRYIEELEEKGTLPFPQARKMPGLNGLWELRVLSRDGAVRIFYVYSDKNQILFVSGFLKKSQKTPEREIERALNYLNQVGVKL